MVIETGTDETAPIILWRPFLNTSRAVIYASTAKISFYIKGKKERFSFKNKTTQISEQTQHEPRKRTNRRNRNKQIWTESAKMVTTVQGGQDHRLKSPFLTKKDDPDFQVIDMGEDEYDPPIILRRLFLSTVKAIIYIETGEVYMHFPFEKVRRYFTDLNYIVEDSKQVRTRRRRRNRNQRRQIIKDGWADYEGEVVRSEDIQLEQNYPEETVAPSQVWREKIVIHEEQAPPEPPTTPSSES